MDSLDPTVWIPEAFEPTPARVRLFCFPHAGGTASLFARWEAQLPEWIQVCPVRLPGREARHREPLPGQITAVAAQFVAALRAAMDLPVALFGHSMGALIAFEAARAMAAAALPPPAVLLASGARAPQTLGGARRREWTDADVLEALEQFAGTPQQVLAQPEFAAVFLPVVRGDFRMCDAYTYRDGPPLDCPIDALFGAEDPIAGASHADGWRAQTAGPFSRTVIRGGHFFLRTAEAETHEAVVRSLERALRRPSLVDARRG